MKTKTYTLIIEQFESNNTRHYIYKALNNLLSIAKKYDVYYSYQSYNDGKNLIVIINCTPGIVEETIDLYIKLYAPELIEQTES